MNCPWVRSQITLYLDNGLDDPERRKVEQRVQRCPAWAAEMERERRLHRALEARTPVSVDAKLLASCRIRLADALENGDAPGLREILGECILNGGGAPLRLRTTSGNIEIRKQQ